MTGLYLKFTNEHGEKKRIPVEEEIFVIGRHSENDLCVVDSNISRRHLEIERFGDSYKATDLNSSNGTILNGTKLKTSEYLQNGDKLNLGGDLEIEVEMLSEESVKKENAGVSDSADFAAAENKSNAEEISAGNSSSFSGTNVSESSSESASGGGINGSSLGFFFILAPLLGLFVLLTIVGALFLFSGEGGSNETAQTQKDEFIFTSDEDDDFLKDVPDDLSSEEDETINNDSSDTNDTGSTDGQTDDSLNSTDTAETANTPSGIETVSTPAETSETDKIRAEALSFMQKIAHEDPRPVVTTKQLSVINAKIKQYQNSSALAENIKDAKSNASQIESLARSKNLKPQFLATAALTKLGNQRGNVVATAQGMLDVLQNLSVQIGTGLANESLIVIAAYNQGVADQNLKMRDTLAKLSNNNPSVSSRQVRTIWFLRDNNAISDAEFELALRFLAIGTITQNPKEFNVNAEALTFN